MHSSYSHFRINSEKQIGININVGIYQHFALSLWMIGIAQIVS